KILSNFLLLRYLKSYICNSVAELRIKKNIDSAPVLPQPPIGRERQTNVLKHKTSAVNKRPVTPLHEVTSHPLSCYLVNYQNL
ncbi:hypothetical protein AAH164_18570, partial [Phocaeicola dorei]|uniref:hypothetical protein n=1 Tax=Phocaeicola dorei TaxID=357276 RepID=UPI0039B6BDC1